MIDSPLGFADVTLPEVVPAPAERARKSAAAKPAKPPRIKITPDTPLPAPFTVLVDVREKAPYSFAGMRADAKDKNRPLVIATQWLTLESGDYSILGPGVDGGEGENLSHLISIERKSKEDLYSTLGQHRDRFERELERLDDMQCGSVVVEAEWADLLSNPPDRSRLNPKTVFRSIISWQQRYRNVHWLCVPSRRAGEITTWRILERFWKGRS